MPKPRCLSPAANSLDSRIAGRQVPKPKYLSPAANSLGIRIAGGTKQVRIPVVPLYIHIYTYMYVMYRPWNYINICNMYSYHTTIYTHYESVLIPLHIYNSPNSACTTEGFLLVLYSNYLGNRKSWSSGA